MPRHARDAIKLYVGGRPLGRPRVTAGTPKDKMHGAAHAECSPRTTLALLLVVGVSASLPSSIMAQQRLAAADEQPLKPERNPPGDIPDNQVFIDYVSPLGFSLKVPEGWARQDLLTACRSPTNMAASPLPRPKPRRCRASKRQSRRLCPSSRRVRTPSPSPPSSRSSFPPDRRCSISYGSNSDPNPVTNKAIRLENDRYYFWKDGKLVAVNFSAPAGADNADQWDMMAKSFRWR